MRSHAVYFATILVGLAACGGSQPAPTSPEPGTSASAPAPAAPAESASSTVATEPAKPQEATAEEKKKAEALRKLNEDRAKWEEERKTELARWTPEVRATAKALADKTYATGRAAIHAAVASKHRKPGNTERDQYRHPVETLAFFGFKPTLTVLEVAPGDGWYSELLAPSLAASGKLVVTTPDPNGPKDERSTFYGQRLKAMLDDAPEIYGKVETVVVDDKHPALGQSSTFDEVLLMREVHGMVNSGTLSAWLSAIHDALKPGGVLGIEEHRAKAGADPLESAKMGYVPEKWLIEQTEAAGFTLAGKSEVNANPKDTKDYPEGVWTLPPTFRLGDTDRARYAAIGESDRMTLKFVKKKR